MKNNDDLLGATDLLREKRDLLNYLIEEEGIEASRANRITASERQDPATLSFAQQRLWFIEQLKPGSCAYNIPGAFMLKGLLNIPALEQSIKEIVRRHESLRTSFPTIDSAPYQSIAQEIKLEFPILDLSALGPNEREGQIESLLMEEAHRPFDLTSGPLLRAKIFRAAEDEHALMLTVHHIVSDGWSIRIFIQEMTSLYKAFSAGGQSPLPELPIQYADFSAWQRQWLTGDVLQEQLSYWREQLGDNLPIINLPIDYRRPAVQRFDGATKSLKLPETLSEAIKAFSHREGTTLFITLLTVYKALLYRYACQRDIVVGAVTANRNRVEVEALIGFFVNTLALRTSLPDEPSFVDLLARVRETAYGAYAHQDLPFEKLVDELRPQRDLSYTPLFQVMFTLNSEHTSPCKMSGVTLRPLRVETSAAKFDLTLYVEESGRSLTASLEYRTDLFEATTIEQMLARFAILLEGILSNPRRKLSELSLLTEVERDQLLSDWQQNLNLRGDRCVQELFEAQAARAPERIALTFEGEQLTFGELNSRANRLSGYLLLHGVGPESLVGLCLDHSIEMIVAILAVWKAGGAYVPLEPVYPKQRLAFILNDIQAPAIITQSHLLDTLPDLNAIVICLDSESEIINQQSDEKPVAAATAGNAAYVIYTSGSTGQPKGVVVTHLNIAWLLNAMATWFRFAETDVWAFFHSYAFDYSVWEIWGALAHGSRLVIVPRLAGRSPEAFYNLLLAEKVTVLNQTPSSFAQLMKVDEAQTEKRSLPLRVINLGGEALDLEALRNWFDRRGDSEPEINNLYGLTEGTVISTYSKIKATEAIDRTGSLIGKRIAAMPMHVLDERLEPVPVGMTGELYFGGDGLARGYLNRPDLTAMRFIPNPYATRQGERLYKTGDLVRHLADGNIEYLGRADEQVKVKGHRIELGEIEALLQRHAKVSESRVLASMRAGDRAQVTAYVVANESDAVSASELRHYLRQNIPEYMIPSSVVMLKALPLTSSGKIDRNALAALESELLDAQADHVDPQTEMEKKITSVWSDLLERQKISVNANFFDLGGNSILMARACGELRNILKKDISMIEMFKYPTVGTLAEHLSQEQIQPPSFADERLRAETRRSMMRRRMRFKQGQVEKSHT